VEVKDTINIVAIILSPIIAVLVTIYLKTDQIKRKKK
jgi:hypothetical protein